MTSFCVKMRRLCKKVLHTHTHTHACVRACVRVFTKPFCPKQDVTKGSSRSSAGLISVFLF